ncbi:MAG: CpsD/CapB family tyrosine-protein kinase [Chthoniobacter sp.]|uniref:CpsD/CapB family tyrosine-protein kinase n=1 Tax=Chthoniobacter sp. TaxID=2510640 RepID=UPI0032A4C78F
MRDIRILGISNHIRTLLLALSALARLSIAQESVLPDGHLADRRFAFALDRGALAPSGRNSLLGEDDFFLALSPAIVGGDAFQEGLYRSDSLRRSRGWNADQHYLAAELAPEPFPEPIAEGPPDDRRYTVDDRPVFVADPRLRRRSLTWPGAFELTLLCLAGLLTFVLMKKDRSFKSVEQTEEELGLAVLSSVPKAGKPRHRAGGQLILQELDSAVAESFRSLRAALSLGSESPAHHVTLFTSAVPGEGKSFCSVHYAVSLAQLGERTLLIDGDLRLPTVHQYFFEEPPEKGVGPVMDGQCELDAAIQATAIPHLFVLPSGRLVPHAAELLAQDAFHDLLRGAREKFERIVVDSAPVHAVSDVLLMLPDAEALCLVIRAGKTSPKAVQRALRLIERANGAIAGVILNGLNTFGVDHFQYGAEDYAKRVYGMAESAKDGS